jgi:hypothetical protein
MTTYTNDIRYSETRPSVLGWPHFSLKVVMLIVIMLIVIMLIVVILIVIMLIVILLIVILLIVAMPNVMASVKIFG